MTTYRVGPVGATVYDPDGTPLLVLQPGQIVVEGTTESTTKRLRGYDDKHLHPRTAAPTSPASDVMLPHTPARQPDPRLRNPQAGTG